jgi:NAD(P)-dependent dehydrogenase (short-subunit alcohol dehydrogenase family)
MLGRFVALTLRDAVGGSPGSSSLSGRTVLITGGTSGTGLACADACHGQGAAIVVGSRSQERYAEAAARLGDVRVHPFLADLADPASVAQALTVLEGEGVRPTDVVHSAAGGLEPIVRPLMRAVVGLRRVDPGAERKAAIARAREELIHLVDETSAAAMRVNVDGPRRLIEGLRRALPDGARVITFASVWSEGTTSGGCPAFYRSVAESKKAFERWLEAVAADPTSHRIQATVLVAHIISDTSTGKLIDRNLVPLMTEPDQVAFRAAYVSTEQVAAAVIQLLAEPQGDAGRLRRVYLDGRDGLIADIPPEVRAVASRVPL